MSDSRDSELYDLASVEATCLDQGLPYRRVSDSEIEVTVGPHMKFIIANTENNTDTYLGFLDVPSHSHGRLTLMTGESTYVEYDPSEVLLNLVSGNVVVVTRYLKGRLHDRWLAHRDEKLDLQHIEPEEEIRIYRIPEQNGSVIDSKS